MYLQGTHLHHLMMRFYIYGDARAYLLPMHRTQHEHALQYMQWGLHLGETGSGGSRTTLIPK